MKRLCFASFAAAALRAGSLAQPGGTDVRISAPPSRLRAALLVASVGLVGAPVHAGALFDRPPVDTDRLSHVRGGFSAPDGGLIVSFGLQRTVLVDGVPVASAANASQWLLLQRGTGNSFSALPGSGAAGTVIQNSLDNQKLQAMTTLDVTANSLQTFRGAALQGMLRSALTDSTRR